MRLLHCGVVLATNQGRICNPLQQSKTCESIAPSGLHKQLWFVASCLCRVWCASRIGKELSFLKTSCRRDGHWIKDFFNAMSSTLPISKTARRDSSLNTIFSLARSCSRHFVRANFDLFDFLTTRYVVRECICDDFLFPEMSTNVHFWNGSHAVLWMLCPLPWRFFVSSRVLALLSQVACCFQMLFTHSSSVGFCGCCCGCCCASQSLFNVTLGAGLGVASLSNNSRSPLWEITR